MRVEQRRRIDLPDNERSVLNAAEAKLSSVIAIMFSSADRLRPSSSARARAPRTHMEMLRREITPPPDPRTMRRAMKYGWQPGPMPGAGPVPGPMPTMNPYG